MAIRDMDLVNGEETGFGQKLKARGCDPWCLCGVQKEPDEFIRLQWTRRESPKESPKKTPTLQITSHPNNLSVASFGSRWPTQVIQALPLLANPSDTSSTSVGQPK